MSSLTGGFTLPGEAGHEDLSLELARRWGADAIRDSDGTSLSPALLDQGMVVYSTVCPIRGHNDFLNAHPHTLQQTFLCTRPHTFVGETLDIVLLEDFFAGQFKVNAGEDSRAYWQVMDRTSNVLLSQDAWEYMEDEGLVRVKQIKPWHSYTVSFLAYRVWEEISMYNHTTNGWQAEHLMPLDPIWPEARAYLVEWLKTWLEKHPHTSIVRFTSLFYNFVWIWGAEERRRILFTDWASYDFTVSPLMLNRFREKTGYAMSAEDFVNKGLYNSTHRVAGQKKLAWMNFVQEQVLDIGRELVSLVHKAGKKAYVFYDDSWVGLEPNSPRFQEYGFDGLIKCVFSGFEARLCANARVPLHELRLHPYLFPVGLGGSPTFSPGGHPEKDARQYWVRIRRALLVEGVQRLGLGGYLSLTRDYPEFVQYMDELLAEFRQLKALHSAGKPALNQTRVAVLHTWGSLRAWTLSGHFHENERQVLMHVVEALSGFPMDVRFIGFDDLSAGALDDVDVLLIAGEAGSAWSGGELWTDEAVETVTAWVYGGGAVLGIKEPSAVPGFNTTLRLAQVLGVDIDEGRYASHGAWQYHSACPAFLEANGASLPEHQGVWMTSKNADVLLEKDGLPVMIEHAFGQGKSIYLSGFKDTPPNARLLYKILLYLGGETSPDFIAQDDAVDCAWFPDSKTIVLANSGEMPLTGSVPVLGTKVPYQLEPYQIKFMKL